jgi:hypothetical protein
MVAIVAAGLLCPAIPSMAPAARERLNGLTWTQDIQPIVQRRCAGCHHAGGAGVPLTEFDQFARLGARIRRDVLSHRMPPWPAAPGFGDFANDSSLTPHEIEVIVSWTFAGMPRGAPGATPGDSAAVPRSPEADLVLTLDGETRVVSRRQRYEVRTSWRRERWIHGWEFVPGDPSAIRQARIGIRGGRMIGVWIPPRGPVFLGAGIALKLPPHATLTFDVEYERPVVETATRSSLRLYLGTRPERELQHVRWGRGITPIASGMRVVAIRPDVNHSGESLRIVAELPDGRVEGLLWVPDFNPRYPVTYRLRRPVWLPSGSRVSIFSFDGNASAEIDWVAE